MPPRPKHWLAKQICEQALSEMSPCLRPTTAMRWQWTSPWHRIRHPITWIPRRLGRRFDWHHQRLRFASQSLEVQYLSPHPTRCGGRLLVWRMLTAATRPQPQTTRVFSVKFQILSLGGECWILSRFYFRCVSSLTSRLRFVTDSIDRFPHRPFSISTDCHVIDLHYFRILVV
jgi:hypothetical protein